MISPDKQSYTLGPIDWKVPIWFCVLLHLAGGLYPEVKGEGYDHDET